MLTPTDHEKQEIAHHVRAIRATRVLEIGAFRGETTRVIVDAVADAGGYVVVIDPMRWSSAIRRRWLARHAVVAGLPSRWPAPVGHLFDLVSYEEAFWRNVGASGGPHVSLYRARSSDTVVLDSDHPELAIFDLAVIDGDRRRDSATRELQRWGGRVREGGLVLVREATSRFPGVVRALRDWGEDPRVDVAWPSRGSLCVARIRASTPTSSHRSDAARTTSRDEPFAGKTMLRDSTPLCDRPGSGSRTDPPGA